MTAFCEGWISLGKVYCEVFTVIFTSFEVFVINNGCYSRACPLYQKWNRLLCSLITLS